jgi:glutamate synthase domain-containing protein 2
VRSLIVAAVAALGIFFAWCAVTINGWWWIVATPICLLAILGIWDLLQTEHSILRAYPIMGHARFIMESIRPEIRQYFIESNSEATPFDRETREMVYERAKGLNSDEPFGTERDVNALGYEFLRHSLRARRPDDQTPRVHIGGAECTQPYDIALLNVSAMSFGALSANAILALNQGAKDGGFAHDTGEGGLSKYHLERGGDLIWEIGSGYFGCRDGDGNFDAEIFATKAKMYAQVKAISIKLSQGAKPGLGGLLPASKVSAEIADARGVLRGKDVISPPAHTQFSTPIEFMHFIARLRQLSGGKPVGFKLCVGARSEFLSICRGMIETNITPDFIIVDGAEGGTGAAPKEFEDHVGMPLTEGLMLVRNSLVGVGLRDRIKIGASGKIASGVDIVTRIIQGADFTMAARAMMFAVGCIQAQACHTNRCPTGVATQDPGRARALYVPNKAKRVQNFQYETVKSAKQIVASMGLSAFDQLDSTMLSRRIEGQRTLAYSELYEWLEPNVLRGGEPPESWRDDWGKSSADEFC